jgi:coenzyme PQQ precursor peptide PqqA
MVEWCRPRRGAIVCVEAAAGAVRRHARGDAAMAWATPTIDETTCGMEINMYFPAEEDAEPAF